MGGDRQEADLTGSADRAADLPRPAAPEDRFARVSLGALFVAFFAAVIAGEPAIDNDVFWHLAIGRTIAESGFPRADPFSFTAPGTPWSPPEWLGELVFFALHGAGGLLALALLRLALCVGLAVLLWTRARTLGASPLAALVVLAIAGAPASVHLPMRPLLFGHVALALVLDQLARLRTGRRHAVLALPALFALWANLHPSWPVGLAALGLASVAWLVTPRVHWLRAVAAPPLPPGDGRRLALATVCSIPVPLLRPDGLDGALYPFVHLVGLGDQASEILEWFPLSWTEPLHVATVLGLALTAVVVVRRRDRDPFELLLVALALVLVVRYQRFLPLATILAGPILAARLPMPAGHAEPKATRSPSPDAPTLARPALVAAGIGAAALMVLAVPSPSTLHARLRAGYPVAAVEWMRQHDVPDRAFNTFELGGYLAWELPERRVYLDSRFDLYAREGVFREYLRLRRGEDVLGIFDERRIDAALVPTPAVDENFVRMAAALEAAGWERAHADSQIEIWQREP